MCIPIRSTERQEREREALESLEMRTNADIPMCWMLLNPQFHAQRRSFLYWLRLHNIQVCTQTTLCDIFTLHGVVCVCMCVHVPRGQFQFFVNIQVRKFSLFLQMLFPVYCIKIELRKLKSTSTSIILLSFSKMMYVFPHCDLVALCNHGDMYTNNTHSDLHNPLYKLQTGNLVNSAIMVANLSVFHAHTHIGNL